MAKIKIPPKLYVTSKYENWNNNSTGAKPIPFGFLGAYEPGKAAFDSRKHTQEKWAYHNYDYAHFKVEQSGPEWWIVGEEWTGWSGHTRLSTPFQKLADPQPQIWDNDPLDGFKILKSVGRFSTSNKLWRIMDPRNIEFEISTACLDQLIQDTGIEKGGLINGKCAWVSNKNLVVIP